MILAAESRGIEPFARIGQNDRQVILKFLDVGVSGVMIPQVSNAARPPARSRPRNTGRTARAASPVAARSTGA